MNFSSTLRPPETLSGAPIASLLRQGEGDVTECLLRRLPQAVVLVDPRGTVTRMSERAAAIVAQGDGLNVRHGVLRCARPADTVVLHRLIGDVARRGGYGDSTMRCGLCIQRPVGRRPLTALVTALRDRDVPANGEAVVAVFVTDPEDAPALDAQLLRDWYGLTPAEARLAALLASGLSLHEIVERLGIAANTARTHLKSIFAKTDTRRQGELIRLLLSSPALVSGPSKILRVSHPNG
jgi:DNA-binding CsgD family transcriptional regulator